MITFISLLTLRALQAVRGAAPSFGVVTSWTFTTDPAPHNLINFNITFPSLTNSDVANNLIAFQQVAASNPDDKLALTCFIKAMDGSDGSKVLNQTFVGTFYGDLLAFNATLQPLLGNITQGWYQYIDPVDDWNKALFGGLGAVQNISDLVSPTHASLQKNMLLTACLCSMIISTPSL